MKERAKTENYTLYEGSMLEMEEHIAPNSIDAIVTDPPYELGFMGKSWDKSGIAFQTETWEKCLNVLKPGGYLLCFGASRNFHRVACAIEDAGFEIRDTILWLYSNSMPKSMNLSKAIESQEKYGKAEARTKRLVDQDCDTDEYVKVQNNNKIKGELMEFTRKESAAGTELARKWTGWGTTLKPGYEPVIVARKPCGGSNTENVIKWGVGGINIDECRVPFESVEDAKSYENNNDCNLRSSKDAGENWSEGITGNWGFKVLKGKREVPQGRFPSNIILTYNDDDGEFLENFPNSGNESPGGAYSYAGKEYQKSVNCFSQKTIKPNSPSNYGGSGSTARFFYNAKCSKRDRDEGLPEGTRNYHPTVKPVSLMQYLVRMVAPKGATILDPFNGSGSTGKAAMYENRDRDAGYNYVGIDLDNHYLDISKERMDFVIEGGIEIEKNTKQKPKLKPDNSSQLELF